MNEAIRYSTLTLDHLQGVSTLLKRVFSYASQEEHYTDDELAWIADQFSEGSIVALSGDRVVGVGIGCFVNFDFNQLPSTENMLVFPNGWMKHVPDGAYYYGTDLAVHPDFRGRRIARNIYDRRKQVIVRHNKRGFLAATVLVGYENEKHRLNIDQYLLKVVEGDIFDPTLSVQLRNGFKVIQPLKEFFLHEPSDHWSALIYWENEQYEHNQD